MLECDFGYFFFTFLLFLLLTSQYLCGCHVQIQKRFNCFIEQSHELSISCTKTSPRVLYTKNCHQHVIWAKNNRKETKYTKVNGEEISAENW